MMTESPAVGSSKTKPVLRVLMVGPAIDRQGGIAAVAGSFISHWDCDRYHLAYVATASDSARLPKVLYFLRAITHFCYQLVFRRPAIVHIHFGWKASFMRKAVLVMLAKLFLVQVVLHCHASRFDLFYEQGSGATRYFIRSILNKANLLLVVSQAWQRYFQTLSLKTPICVLYNSVSSPADIPSVDDRQPVILTLGRLGRRKGTYDILEAVPEILSSHPEARFWLAGDGEVAEVQQRLAEQPWGSHVDLLGWIKDEHKQHVLGQSSIFLLPSYHEGLPIAILEAMAYGLPVISCPVGGIGEVVKECETGFLVQPGDIEAVVERVTLLLREKELRRKLGNNARELIRTSYDIKANIQRLISLYDALLEGVVPCRENE